MGQANKNGFRLWREGPFDFPSHEFQRRKSKPSRDAITRLRDVVINDRFIIKCHSSPEDANLYARLAKFTANRNPSLAHRFEGVDCEVKCDIVTS